MTTICFLDGARFRDVPGFLRALYHAIEEMPAPERNAEILRDLLLDRSDLGPRPTRLHVVWLNSELSRRTLGAQVVVPGRSHENAFDAATRWLATCRSIDLVLL